MRHFALALLALGACGGDKLVQATSSVHVSPAAIDFGQRYVQARATQSISLVNAGAGSESVVVTYTGGAAFSVASKTYALAGGDTASIAVDFAPTEPGVDAASVHLAWNSGSTDVALTGSALAWPACPTAGNCQRSSFDPQAGACQLQWLADGTACVSDDGCLVNTLCASGQCLGQLANCDDGDACTTDYCIPGQGCQHTSTAAACTGDDPCQAYRCDPSSGCTSDAVADGTPCSSDLSCRTAGLCEFGHCVDVPVPDGTACALPWAPCVSDATCEGGTCDSPTADAWRPGQVLWTYDVDAGAPSYRSVQAVDDDGNIFVIDEGTRQLFSLDACGRTRWSQTLDAYPYAAMLSSGRLFVEEGGLLKAHDASTGQQLWSVDVAQLFGDCDGGGACGAGIEGSVYAGPPVLSNQGQLFLTGSTSTQPWALQLASITTGGVPQWVQREGDIQVVMYGANSVADAQGNFYTYLLGNSDTLQSFDRQGQLRFQKPSWAQTNLAVGNDFVLDLGGNPTTAWSDTGAQLFTLSTNIVPSPQFSSSAVIDAHGSFIFWPGWASTDHPGLVRVDGTGQQRASVIIVGGPMSEVALDESGRAYVLGIGDPQDFDLWVWDGQSPALSLAADLGPAFDGYQQRSNGYNLFVTHGAALVTLDQAITAVYVGPHGAATNAPWPRGVGGTNENRHAPNIGP